MINLFSKIFIKYIVWDFDGTLYQNEKLGIDIKQFFYHQCKNKVTLKEFDELSKIEGSWSSASSRITTINETSLMDECDKKIDKALYLRRNTKITDIIENKLSRYKHLILTNSTAKEASQCLTKIGFKSSTFIKIFGRDTTHLLKPNPEIYAQITSYTKSPKFRHLFVGDSIIHDINPPKKYGFLALPIWEINSFVLPQK